MLNNMRRILNPEVINPMFRQLAGYMVSPLFIFYLIGVAYTPFLLKKSYKYKVKRLQVIKIIITISAAIIIPLVFFRYTKNSSFTYLVHGVSLISLIPVIALSSILEKTKNKISEQLLVGIIAVICLQAHIFLVPSNYMHNPVNSIIKDYFKQPGEDIFSIESAREVAKIIDRNTLPGDKVLFDQYSPLVFSKAIAIPGMEMNLYDNFFDKENWINVKIIYKHESNPVSRSAREVMNYIENGDVTLIVTSGRTSKDLIEVVNELYCLIDTYGKYNIYNICQDKNL